LWLFGFLENEYVIVTFGINHDHYFDQLKEEGLKKAKYKDISIFLLD